MKTFINYLNENKIESIMKTDEFSRKLWVIPNTEDDSFSFLGYGVLHREDGPAIEYPSGAKEWFINGKYHREDGPAVEFKSGTIGWYLKGKMIEPSIEMMSKYIRLNPDNIFTHYKWPKEMQALAIELGGEKIRVKLMANNKLDSSLMDKFSDLNKRGFFS